MNTYLIIILFSSLITAAGGSTGVSSTVVALSDNDLYQLLQSLVFSQIPGNDIPYTLLVANGLNTQSVIAFLLELGYHIF
jgi:hypothetical protein